VVEVVFENIDVNGHSDTNVTVSVTGRSRGLAIIAEAVSFVKEKLYMTRPPRQIAPLGFATHCIWTNSAVVVVAKTVNGTAVPVEPVMYAAVTGTR